MRASTVSQDFKWGFPFQTPHLGPQRRHFRAQRGVLLHKLQIQLLEIVQAEIVNVW